MYATMPKLFKGLFYIIYVFMYVPTEARRGVRSLRAGVRDVCQPFSIGAGI